ncbi:uncharacterized protein IL334_004323 [Kwoniella shivajii]|uniref:HBS1-like protein N-terminal domain-containing protein n=1 Tax=Kwoniella shivajii TaxID=564305 RepID=A0ABZ1D1A2_9TREE|nr:hypothetical protein IL334_004323 [Kwoniella shivajii]
MSRHRDIRNLDLDEEMIEDEEEEGYSKEEQAQMASAMPIARSALKDFKPPISDDAIADSLWHYWFDVEKAVGWLKQDHEKKGEAPPCSLQPTPKEQPRRRPKNLLPQSTSLSTNSPQPPLTALQRLSLSRKQASSSPSPSQPPIPIISAGTAEDGTKPMSKLALLAQKRKEAAAQAANTAPDTPQTPSKATSASIPADVGQRSTSQSASKPLSKLAQKMAAARVAREEASSKMDITPSDAITMEVDQTSPTDIPSQESANDIFPSFTPSPKTRNTAPSTFFSILTSTSSFDSSKDETGITNLHVPLATDISELTKRFEQAFAESPDEIVLRKRQGRAGTADLATAVKKQAKGTGPKPK